MTKTEKEVKAFTKAYKECMEWADDFDVDTLDNALVLRIDSECNVFATNNASLINGNFSQAGHDFWLTRQGHGAGFWDRPEIYGKENGEKLTKQCELIGACHYLY
jgi:hypothetical protein